jgi:hypothetical protein
MTGCERQASGAIELYFYDELDAIERADVGRHLRTCRECRAALEELTVIRAALESRPAVDAPPGGEWSPFMQRLDEAISFERHVDGVSRGGPRAVAHVQDRAPRGGPTLVTYLAMAALLTLVTSGVAFVARSTSLPAPDDRATADADAETPATAPPAADRSAAAFAALSEQHFERSKLVVIGLANKNPAQVLEDDWAYERGLASDLLSDTRVYRQVAEERGMTALAGVMGDLELVLLQTSLAEGPDADALQQIQRLIHKRDLVTKMAAGL